jgi:hypothetical protein
MHANRTRQFPNPCFSCVNHVILLGIQNRYLPLYVSLDRHSSPLQHCDTDRGDSTTHQTGPSIDYWRRGSIARVRQYARSRHRHCVTVVILPPAPPDGGGFHGPPGPPGPPGCPPGPPGGAGGLVVQSHGTVMVTFVGEPASLQTVQTVTVSVNPGGT